MNLRYAYFKLFAIETFVPQTWSWDGTQEGNESNEVRFGKACDEVRFGKACNEVSFGKGKSKGKKFQGELEKQTEQSQFGKVGEHDFVCLAIHTHM